VDVTLPRLQKWVGRLHGYELEVSRHPLPFVAGMVTGALLLGLLWIFPSGRSDSPAGFVGAAEVLGAQQTAESKEAAPGDGRLERCREVFAAQTRPLRAVPAPLSQWQVHIGAMNKLVTGVITLRQATRFWSQTRVGAARGLARYRSASEAFGQRTARCPRTADAASPKEVLRCTEAVAARGRELATADRALATWRVHVRHMEMLRTGEMSPARATQLWLMSWHAGVRELAAYRAAAREASGRTC
jgi:hypothetical protein